MSKSVDVIGSTFLFTVIFVLLGPMWVVGQPTDWVILPNSPRVARFNDASFVDESNGWVVNGEGEIYRTIDRGETWQLMLSSPTTHFRSVGFLNDSLGFAGSVGLGEFGNTDPVVLRETRDGGVTWTPVGSFDGAPPVGLCGMQVVNDSMIVSVGRVRGPAWFVKTTDSGATWQTVKLDSLAAGLIDVRFFDPDTGFAVGLTNSNHEQSSGVVLATTDGGQTWSRRFTTSRTGEWFWKASFPTRNVGYVSLQRNSQSPIYFVKTTDGGETWQEKIFSQQYYFVQGIGFIDENTGWIGGNSSQYTRETTDGGETWSSAGFGSRVNRFRFLGDTLAYAVGRRVYRYEVGSPVRSENDELPDLPSIFTSVENFPNPFTTGTTIQFGMDHVSEVSLEVVDVLGRPIRRLVDGRLQPGKHRIEWDGRDAGGRSVASGVYVFRLDAEGQRISRAMLLTE